MEPRRHARRAAFDPRPTLVAPPDDPPPDWAVTVTKVVTYYSLLAGAVTLCVGAYWSWRRVRGL